MVEVRWAGYPRSYTKGRRRKPQFVTLHYTAGSEGPTSAEAGVAYDKRRTDGTSAHYYTDSLGPALQEVPEGDRAHTARFHGNEIGIHIEICGTRQTREQWLDGTSLATLRTTAGLVADICRRQGFATRRLTTTQTRAAYYAAEGKRPTGINDHYDCTRAFPEDGGDHTDVGSAFPWDVFMRLVTEQEDDMAEVKQADFDALIWRVEAMLNNRPAVAGGPTKGEKNQLAAKLTAVEADVEELKTKPVEVAIDQAMLTAALADPTLLAAQAAAVNEDAAKRLAD